MHVTISHYYNPQPPVYKVLTVGLGNQAIKGAVDMRWEPTGNGGVQKEPGRLEPPLPLRDLTGPHPSPHYMYRTTTYSQCLFKSSQCIGLHLPKYLLCTITPRWKDSTVTELFMTGNCIKNLKALTTVLSPLAAKICSLKSAFTVFWPRKHMVTMRIY